MPDENVASIGSNQTSQDDQSVVNQDGNDFVLDFGGEENNSEAEVSNVEAVNLETEQTADEESSDSIDVDFGSDFFDGENGDENGVESETVELNDNKENIENADDAEYNNDFEISFDKPSDEKYDDQDDENETEEESEDLFNSDGNQEKEISENKDMDSEVVEENVDTQVVENQDNGNVVGSELVENKGNDFLMSGQGDNDSEGEEANDVDNEGFLLDSDLNKDGGSVDESSPDDQSQERNDDINIDSVEDGVIGVEIEGSKDDAFLLDDKHDVEEMFKDENVGVNLNEGEGSEDSESSVNQSIFINDVDDNVESSVDNVENSVSNVDGSVDNVENSASNVESSTNNEMEYLKQPEISDLLGDSPVEFSLGSSEEHIVENNDESDKEPESNISDVDENANLVEDNKYSVSNENENSLSNENKDSSVLINNYVDGQEGVVREDNVNESVSETSSESVQANVETGIQMDIKADVVDTDNYSEDTSLTNNMTSTLSLDQILDTELNNNPQFADNSKAVPINVTNRNGWFGNKMGIVVGIGVFLLAGITAVLAFPPRDSDRKPGSVVNTGENVQEYIDHNVADIVEETGGVQEDVIKQDGGEIEAHTSKVTVQQPDFPDAGWEAEEGLVDSNLGEPIPYVCDGEDCAGEDAGGNQDKQIEIGEVMQVILNFKSQAEIYYSQGDEMQDKKLIKYALQTISLCDNYQKQVEDGEGLDEVSFSSFKSKGEKLLDKMETYLIGEDYSELFQ